MLIIIDPPPNAGPAGRGSAVTLHREPLEGEPPSPRDLGGALHIIVTAVTLRDLSQRSDAQVRGPRWFWRAFTPLQMGNSAVYWLVARRNV